MSPATGAPPRRRPADAHAGAAARPGGRPPLDPRIGHRRAQVTRRRGRRRLWVLAAAASVTAAALGAWLLLHSGAFSARVVTVVGSTHTPAARIVAVAGLSEHPPLIDIDTTVVAQRVESLPWVSRARVEKEWPDGVRITVVDATPAAAVALAPKKGATPDTWALVDQRGRVLADAGAQPAGLPLLVAADHPGAPGTWLGRGASPGLDVATTLPRAFRAQVTAVVVGSDGQVSLRMTTPVTAELGNTSQLAKKYEDVAAVLAGAKLVAGDVINVSAPGSPTVGQG